MQQFSNVLKELNKWFQSFSWFQLLSKYNLYILFGALGILFLRDLLYWILPLGSYRTLNTIFITIPLSEIAYLAFLLGVWITLASRQVKYVPYALWGRAFLILFPFTAISLSSLISCAVYAFLGYALFRYTASEYAAH